MADLAQLLPVSKAQFSGEEQLCVNMRNVHTALAVQSRYNDWINRRINQYGFEEHVDYEVLLNSEYNSVGGRPQTDYYFTLDAAKEIAMVENNEKGREIRKYFIACEKRLRKALPNFDDPAAAAEAWAKEYRARRVAEAEKEKAQAALQAEQSAHLDTQYDLLVAQHNLTELNDKYSVATEMGSVDDMRSAYDMQVALIKYFDTGKCLGTKGFWWYMSGFMHTYCHGGIRYNKYFGGVEYALPGELIGHVYHIVKRDNTTVFPKRAWADVIAYFEHHRDSLKDLPRIGYAAR